MLLTPIRSKPCYIVIRGHSGRWRHHLELVLLSNSPRIAAMTILVFGLSDCIEEGRLSVTTPLLDAIFEVTSAHYAATLFSMGLS